MIAVDKCTVLHCAVRFSHHEIVRRLLDFGANSDTQRKGGETPIFDAVVRRGSRMVNILLESKANLFTCTTGGQIPLHIAAGHGSDQLVLQLIDEEPGTALQEDERGWHSLHYTALSGYVKILNVLMNVRSETLKLEDQMSYVSAADKMDAIQLIRYLLIIYPDNRILWRSIGNEYLQRNRLAKAVSAFDESYSTAIGWSRTEGIETVDLGSGCGTRIQEAQFKFVDGTEWDFSDVCIEYREACGFNT